MLEEKWIKKRNNALSLTQNGKNRQKEPLSIRFIQYLLHFGMQFHWSNFFDQQLPSEIGQMGWAYSLYLLKKYGNEPRDTLFYSEKLYQAFGDNFYYHLKGNNKEEFFPSFYWAYSNSYFESFALWFVFVTLERIRNPESPYPKGYQDSPFG